MKRLVHKNLVGITQSSLIARTGQELVAVFLPLLLINRGLALWQVCAYYVGYALVKSAINYPCIRLINRRGARLGMIVGYSATTIYMALLTLFVSGMWDGAIWLLPVAMAFQNAFMWTSTHLHISRVMDTTRKSRDIAMIQNIERVAGVIAPAIGGIIAASAGQTWLVAVAAMIVIFALYPIWHIDELAGGHEPVKNMKYSLKYAPMRDLFANLSFNIHSSVGLMVWPIYLAVFIPDFRSIGYIITIASAITVVVLHFVGKRGDEGKTSRVLLEGTAASSAVHIGRVLANSNPLTITLVSAAYDTALSYQQNPWVSIYYHHARNKTAKYILSMEIISDIAYVLLWGTLGIVAYLTQDNTFFTVAFVSSAIIAWGCMLITKEKN